MSNQQAYPQTRPGKIEVKRLPSAVIMEAERKGKDYFDSRDRDATPFMPLFRYIQSHKIPMTTPVEVDVDENRMWFFAPPGTTLASDGSMLSSPQVEIREIPARDVLSIGLRGRYSESSFQAGLQQLEVWLEQHPGWKAAGKPYAVYWNSPMTLFFLKKSEVHLPVKEC